MPSRAAAAIEQQPTPKQLAHALLPAPPAKQSRCVSALAMPIHPAAAIEQQPAPKQLAHAPLPALPVKQSR